MFILAFFEISFKIFLSVSSNPRICYATSSDGISWTKPSLGIVDYGGNTNNNIVLDKRGAGESYEIRVGTVLKIGTEYKMWYTGRGDPYAEGAIGYANGSW
jgi:hypothetical protein